MAYTRQWLVDILRRIGYTQAAGDGSREMPEEFDLKRLASGIPWSMSVAGTLD
jgi:hypothetical protein